MLNKIEYYKAAFSNLHVKIVGGKKYPHKAILLISIIDLVRSGYIARNNIMLDDTIRAAFEYNWRIFINSTPPVVWTPFWHMKNEFFWHFHPIRASVDTDTLVKRGATASYGLMKREIEYAYLDDDLFNIIQQPSGRSELISVLRTMLPPIYK